VAAGYSYSSASSGLLVSGAGTRWKAVAAPVPGARAADSFISLGSVACPSAGSCVAAGGYEDSKSVNQGLLDTGSGTRWNPAKAPVPAPYVAASLNSVACPSASSCVAIGYYNNTAGLPGMVLTGSGGTWQAITAPQPADSTSPDAGLYSVACPSTDFCIAVGDYQGAVSEGLLLVGPG
jgi:hypothetical protein